MGHVTSPEIMHRGAIDNYSLDWYPRFRCIPPPLPSASVPRPVATPGEGAARRPARPTTRPPPLPFSGGLSPPLPKWEGRRSLLPSRKREGRRASVFAGAGTYSMGQPRRVSTQSARWQGASSAHRRSQALAGGRPWGVRILAPVHRRVETGPGREASGGRMGSSAPSPARGALLRGAGRHARASEAAWTGPRKAAGTQITHS